MRFEHVGLLVIFAVALALPGARAARAHGLATAPSNPVVANLWVDGNGGKCDRSPSAMPYRSRAACGSIDAAWNACRPGDTIEIKSGVYPAQTITGDKAAPGCTVSGENGTTGDQTNGAGGGGGVTIGDLVTRGAFFRLDNVTVDVGEAKRAGWEDSASNVTLTQVRLHGPFVSVEIAHASNVSWIRGELGAPGQIGGARVCGQDAEPMQIGDADHVTVDGIRFHPQNADPTPNDCSANGFHLEMIRIDGGTSFFTLRNSTFDSGDHSGTASIFITEPGGYVDPHDLTFENNFFGTNDSVGAFDVHPNVSPCVNFTFAYNTFLAPLGAFQCTSAINTRWIGNLGSRSPSSPCFGTFTNNVWQDTSRDACGIDTWVQGARGRTDKLGLGGPDGFHLQPRSPAIKAGERDGYCTTTLGAKDHAGRPRPSGIRCDAGADQYVGVGGATVASLVARQWTRNASVARVLTLTLDVHESVAVEIRLVRGSRLVARRRYSELRTGTRMPTLTLPSGVTAGSARLQITLDNGAGNKMVIQQRIQIRR